MSYKPIIRIVGKKGSKACKNIIEDTSVRRMLNKKNKADTVINYGLAGKNLRTLYRKIPTTKSIPMINRKVGFSKFHVVRLAEKEGILVPKSRASLKKSDDLSLWIEKKTNSIGGIGIRKARNRTAREGKYYQLLIKDRRYELRVHAFGWVKTWEVQKRYGKNTEIAWNYKNGGHFQTVRNTNLRIIREAIDVSKKVLSMLNMQFGAVDFIVGDNGKVYFIEINSAPGFEELSRHIYTDAFSELERMTIKQLSKYTT